MDNYPVRPFVFYRGMVNEFMNLSLDELIEIKFFLHEDKENKLDITNGYIKFFTIITSAFLGDSLIGKLRSEVLENIFESMVVNNGSIHYCSSNYVIDNGS